MYRVCLMVEKNNCDRFGAIQICILHDTKETILSLRLDFYCSQLCISITIHRKTIALKINLNAYQMCDALHNTAILLNLMLCLSSRAIHLPQ